MDAHPPWRDQAFSRLGEGLVVQAGDGRIIDCNASAERILGLTYDQLTGRTSMDERWAAIHEDGSPFPGEEHPAMVVLRTGEPVRDVVMGVHRPDGSYVWILVNAEPLDSVTDARVVASFTDITGEKDRVSQRMRATVDSLLDPHVLFQPVRDAGGRLADMRFIEINDSALAYLEQERAALHGRLLTEVMAGPEPQLVLRTMLRVASTGEAFLADSMPVAGAEPPRFLDVRAVRVGQFISVTWRDVTDRVRSAERLSASEELFRAAMESAVTGMAIAGHDGLLTVVNDALCVMVQHDAKQLYERSLPDLAEPHFGEELRAALRRLESGQKQQLVLEGPLRRRDGSDCWVQAGLALLRADGESRGVLVQLTDITGEYEAREALQYQAFHDALTGLRNRASLLDLLDVELRAAKRKQGRVGVLFLDLDNFKIVNDSLGHAAGDEILKTVAGRLQSVVRPRDHAGRFGGDEFVVVVTDIDEARQLEVVADRILNAVADEIVVQEHRILPTASIGLAMSHADSTTESLLREADAALFRAKDAGRSRWQFFDEQMHAHALERMTLEAQIREGLEHDEFLVHYQPIVDLTTGEISSYEALARWNHPVRGLLAAGEFVPAAEVSGAIVPLGEVVLEQVVEVLAAHPDLPPVSINVSAVQLAAPRWMATFLQTLGRREVDPSRVILEVTETAVLSLLDPTTMDLVVLQEYGVGIHVDDFGTGFSSISMLRELPVTGLKLDARFVHDLTVEDSPSNALAEGLAGLARGLDLISVAEGIETEEQAKLLTEQGWTHGQGYLFGKPGPLA
ncbi:MAG: EAL domain-containing protein [Actinobacteria bacterium]|nr:EAL domain-containing protein [Actinomycetota bacterium]MCB8997853.1 EAL domain-containing protein [Actinomycetota bacterium]MCB9414253.1 EAL domain-containing protein [Actinomycetota bacterium]MCB9423997.1 EAL domain-containing protein [Actinomycetota bacterium]HRY09700.1 EAL domain-containing protein [Candidatus Nanopelagicales bacterium]